MKELKKGKSTSSTPPQETKESRMQKPPIYTTKYGTQYVRIIDIIQSEDGWAEIQRLRDANLVKPTSKNGAGKVGSPTEAETK
jgi:hypothetical protein